MRVRISILFGAVLLLFAASGPEMLAAEGDQLEVPTTYVTHDQHRATAPHPPGDVLAIWEEQGTVELGPTPPPGTGWVPSGPRLQYGSIRLGGRSYFVVLGHREGTSAVLGLDRDGDLGLRGEGEVTDLSGRWVKQGGHPALRWKLPKRDIGTLRLELTFQQLGRSWDALIVTASGPVSVALSDQIPPGTRLLTNATYVRHGKLSTPQGPLSAAFLRDDAQKLVVLLDRDRNGVLGDAGETLVGVVQARNQKEVIWKVEGVPCDAGTATLAYRESSPQAHVTYKATALGARRGSIMRGTTQYVLQVVDGDFDGTYGSSGDWWWFGPMNGLKKFKRLTLDSMIEAGQPFHVDAPWQLMAVGSDGRALLAKNPTAKDPHDYLHARTERVNAERWFPKFERTAQFAEEQGIDLGRPKAAFLPDWYHDVGLREILRRAKAQRKPVLIDFEADWCKICKCWDYYVYGDREVAGLLAGFLRLKVNVDFNFANDMTKYGGKNPPYLVFLDPDGNVLLSFPEVDQRGKETGRDVNGLGSFQRPQDFAATLRAALKACRDRGF